MILARLWNFPCRLPLWAFQDLYGAPWWVYAFCFLAGGLGIMCGLVWLVCLLLHSVFGIGIGLGWDVSWGVCCPPIFEVGFGFGFVCFVVGMRPFSFGKSMLR